MIIRDESFLTARDFRIHEAAHVAVGVMLRLPMALPEVFRDGSGGRANFAWDEIEVGASQALPDEVSASTERKAAVNIGAMYLAGYCAEGIASGANLDFIIGAKTHDLIQALRVLDLVNASHNDLLLSWDLARKILTHTWPAVLELAEMVPVTDGTHRPPIFH